MTNKQSWGDNWEDEFDKICDEMCSGETYNIKFHGKCFIQKLLTSKSEENIIAMERYGENCKKDEGKRLVEQMEMKKKKTDTFEMSDYEASEVRNYEIAFNAGIDVGIEILKK